MFAAVGVHPNEGASWDADTISKLTLLAGNKSVVAIGEIGLDYYREKVDPATQARIFKDQLALAAELELPVIFHSRNSSDDLYTILSEWCAHLEKARSPLAKRPGVLHAFEGDAAAPDRFFKLNFFFGVGGPITYKNALDRQALVTHLPIERILLETDAPFLTPQPYRGQRNEPAHIQIIAEQIARLKAVSLEDIALATTKNAAFLFSREF